MICFHGVGGCFQCALQRLVRKQGPFETSDLRYRQLVGDSDGGRLLDERRLPELAPH